MAFNVQSAGFLISAVDLYQIIKDNCPDAVKTGEIKNQFGRKVAIVRREAPVTTDSLTLVDRMRKSPQSHI